MSDSINSQRAALQLLADYKSAGLTHLPPPAEVLPVVDENLVIEATEDQSTTGQNVAMEEQQAVDLPDSSRVTNPEQALAELAVTVSKCALCTELAESRTQTVFGVGNPNAQVMFIGEAPGADEDASGEPFVGKAGQLLTKIIGACGWTREEIYICNILRCRPPANRNPTDEEAANCRQFLDGQIEIVAPEYIVCWGSVAAKNLLRTDDSIGKLRGHFFDYAGAKVLCTYHPSYLLRNPSAKKPVWEDMQRLLAEMGLKPPTQ